MATNLNALRIFHTVFTTRSMTEAAKLLHLTQSGVSQHIKGLEDELGFALFERVKRNLFPTHKAEALFHRTEIVIKEVDGAVRDLKGIKETIEGQVRIGLPVEFGNNVIIPLLSKLGQQYPGLKFLITYDFATTLSRLVLSDELDFALIDRFKVDKKLRLETIATESLLLCGKKSYVKNFGPLRYNAQYFSRFEFVDYKVGEPLLRSWFRHHLGRYNLPLHVRAHLFDVQGVSKFVTEGFGLGIIPNHHVEKLQKSGEDLFIFEGKKTPLKNEMCLVSLPRKDRPLYQTKVMEQLILLNN